MLESWFPIWLSCVGPDDSRFQNNHMKTEKEKMLAGELYDASDAQLCAERRRARDLCKALNDSRDEEQDRRAGIVRELFGSAGDAVWIEPPFYCDYGTNITLGEKVYFNFNCVVLDPALVSIGSNVLLVQQCRFIAPVTQSARRSDAPGWSSLARSRSGQTFGSAVERSFSLASASAQAPLWVPAV